MKLILIDGNALGYSCHASNVLTANGMQTQAIYGFAKKVHYLRHRYPDHQIIILWDGAKNWRYDIYPEYKSQRNDDPKVAAARKLYKDQVPYIIELMTNLGIPNVLPKAGEADDLAGIFCEVANRRGDEVILYTKDGDWKQLVSENIRWYDFTADNWVTLENFHAVTGFKTPERFLRGKALMGDGSDHIKGVGGIGEKAAKLIMDMYPSVWDISVLDIPPELSKWRKKITTLLTEPKGVEIYQRNMMLMDLIRPYKEGVSPVNESTINLVTDPKNVREILEEHQFRTLLNKFDNYIEPFI